MESPSISKTVLKSLRKICGHDGVSLKENHRIAYSRDSSTPSLIEIREGHVTHPPDVVVWPRSTEEVSQALRLASEERMPLVPYGAGSGVCGGAVPVRAGIVLDLKKMDRIIAIDSDHLRVTAQPGIIGEILERRLKEGGLTLGHFPSSIYTATLGGYLACRSAGQLSTKYGKIEDMVRALKVCLADGQVLRLDGEGAFDLRELFVGSEGTLGVMTEATLAVHPQPEAQKYFGFRFAGLKQGLKAIRRLLQQGLKPAVVRLYDPLATVMSFSKGDHSSPFLEKLLASLPDSFRRRLSHFKTDSFRFLLSQAAVLNRLIELSLFRSLLILGFEGPSWKVAAECREALAILKEEGAENLGEEVGLDWLRRRYSVSYKMSPIMDQGCFADTMEVAAPWSRLTDLYRGIRSALRDDALVMGHFSHAYPDGCSIYFTFAGYRASEEGSLKLHRKIWDEGLKACLEHGGTISHHHGIGYLKADAFREELGPLHDWFRKVKGVLDPSGILNPGKMGL